MENIHYFFTTISISLVTLAFVSYFIISRLKTISKYFTDKMGEEPGQIRLVLFQRLIGVLFFGILPAAIFLLLKHTLVIKYCLRIHFNISSLNLVFTFGIIAVLINYFAARSPENLSMYPQIRSKIWTIPLLLLSVLSWSAYLFAYEFLFRGILLLLCYQELGIFFSIAINICLYALVHIPKGIKETIGAIPLGIVLCLLTLHFGTIWAAFWIHCCLALSNEWFSIKYNPEMIVKIR